MPPRRAYCCLTLLHACLLALFAASAGFSAATAGEPWSYNGDENGEINWGSISKIFKICETGTSQSPIEISSAEISANLPPLAFSYASSKASVSFTAHAIHAVPQSHNTLRIGNQSYGLRSIELHTPSEHMIGERYYPLEIHLVHEDAGHNKLIVAVFAEPGAGNRALAAIAAHASSQASLESEIDLDPALLIPPRLSYYAYSGSLTYPPCTEGVQWRVLRMPITLSSDDFSRIAAISGRNARMTQPVYLRSVLQSAQ